MIEDKEIGELWREWINEREHVGGIIICNLIRKLIVERARRHECYQKEGGWGDQLWELDNKYMNQARQNFGIENDPSSL